MNDMQKKIKELLEMYQGRRVMDTGIVANKLVSLLEQVAREQRGLCSVNWSKPTSGTIEDARLILEAPLVTDNLTFNED